MAKPIKMTVEMDLSKIDKFQDLLQEVKELNELVPDYLEYKSEQHLDRILELSTECYQVYKN